jgi:nucleoside-diphosphate-sugar epimerase
LNTVLIVGATGMIGEAALAHFSGARNWRTVAVSRRTPEPVVSGEFRHLPLDLTDAAACRQACQQLGDVTHVIYAAVSEQPGLVSGWRDPQQMQANLAMLRNLLEPLAATAPGLRHLILMQGAKAYGTHAGHQPPVPAREAAPRVAHDNFYWLQEDYLRAKARECGFCWTIFRPQVVVGAAWGSAMNPLLPVAVFAALRREEGRPFSYPGGLPQLAEIVDATLLAEACEWAALAGEAQFETFNITNGDVFAWREAWPVLADALRVDVGPDEPLRLAEYLSARAPLWNTIAARAGLRVLELPRLLGQSHHYIDLLLRGGTDPGRRPLLLSTIKLRLAGFSACRDSEQVIRRCIGTLRERRLIPWH